MFDNDCSSVVDISCSICSLNGEDTIEQSLGRLILTYQKDSKVSHTVAILVRIPNLILDKVFH